MSLNEGLGFKIYTDSKQSKIKEATLSISSRADLKQPAPFIKELVANGTRIV